MTFKKKYYLDNAASTEIDKDILRKVCTMLSESFGNPSSIHSHGRNVKNIIEQSRRSCLDVLNIKDYSVLFFSSASEVISTIIRSVAGDNIGKKILIFESEHASTIYSAKYWCKIYSLKLEQVKVHNDGLPNIEDFESKLTEDVCMVVASYVNNETGVIFPIYEISEKTIDRNIFLLVDAVAAFGKIEDFNIYAGMSAVVISGHKIYGPYGVAICVLSNRYRICGMIFGGNQEQGIRAGTENVGAIYGMSLAMLKIKELGDSSISHMRKNRDFFEKFILDNIKGASINGNIDSRASNISNIYFPNIDGHTFLIALDKHNISASQGSACHSGINNVSHVLEAMHIDKERILSSFRFSFCHQDKHEDIVDVAKIIVSVFNKMHKKS